MKKSAETRVVIEDNPLLDVSTPSSNKFEEMLDIDVKSVMMVDANIMK